MKKITLLLLTAVLLFLTGCNSKATIEITEEEFQEELEMVLSQYARQGQPIPEDQIPMLKASLLENLIEKEVLLHSIEADNFAIPEDMISAQMESIKTGFESDEAFHNALEAMGYTEESLLTQMTEVMTIEEFLKVKTEELIEITDEDIETFYNENPQYFTQGETATASHIIISVEPTASEDVKKDAMERILLIKAKADAGKDFAELAVQFSEGPSGPNGGSLGSFGRGQMVPEFEAAVFSMEPGQISDVVETQFGYHIIKLDSINEGFVRPLEEVAQSIKDFLKGKESDEAQTTFIEEEIAKYTIKTPVLEDQPQEELEENS